MRGREECAGVKKVKCEWGCYGRRTYGRPEWGTKGARVGVPGGACMGGTGSIECGRLAGRDRQKE